LSNSYLNQKYIFELNTRIFCLKHHCTLEEFPDWFFQSPEVLAADLVWFMGVWKSSPKSMEICKTHTGLRHEFQKCLPDLRENDILGSPYAIWEYSPNPIVAKGFEGLRKVKQQLNQMGKKLILDFVPNHMSVDTIYLEKHPEYFLQKKEGETVCQNSFYHAPTGKIFFHGRDPYFDGWTDTVQWDFSHPEVLQLHKEILLKIGSVCDGVRCDMAMLPLPDIFEHTHGKYALEYWKPLIESTKDKYNNFLFMGEVYWNREYELQQLGFDFTYDKTLYDRLKNRETFEIKSHLDATIEYQKKSIRFLENHDEERAYNTFQESSISLFALLSFLPGMILYYEGQSEGAIHKVPVQLGRAPQNDTNEIAIEFYKRAFQQIQKRKSKEYLYYNTSFNSYEAIGYNPLIIKCISVSNSKDPNFSLEILFFNPEDRIISGWFRFDSSICKKLENVSKSELVFTDVVTGESYVFSRYEILEKGIYIKLPPFRSHWFVLKDSGENNNKNSKV
jgi:hypothetical protein